MLKKTFSDFKAFCAKGNILELATGIMIGGAFTSIVNSLVNDILMPVIGILTKNVQLSGLFIPLDFQFGKYPSIEAAQAAGVGTLNYGSFLQAIVNFIIIAFCVFLLVRLMGKLIRKQEAKPVRKCPYCKQPVDDEAVKCPHCASDISDSVILPEEAAAKA